MAHLQQQRFFQKVKDQFPGFFKGVRVLDVGSYDVNGNLRHFFDQPSWYTGIDIANGPNVDVVCPGHLFWSPFKFDAVVSAECLEHDMYWEKTRANMFDLLKSGGLMAFSCATTGRPEHGTQRAEPSSAPPVLKAGREWSEHYLNLTEFDVRRVLDIEACFRAAEFEVNETTHDLYFWGIKRG